MAFEIEDKRLLEKTLKIRENIIDELLVDGTPKEKADREFLLSVIDGTERTVINKTKVKVDEQNSQNQAQTQEMVASILLRLSAVNSNSRNGSVSVPSNIVVDDLKPGEISMSTEKTTFDDFMKKMS